MLRTAIIFALMLLAATAYASSESVGIDILGSNVGNTVIAAGAGSVNMDVLGSTTGDANIISGGGASADIEVIGSRTGNITISPKKSIKKHGCCDGWCDFRKPLCYPYTSYIPARYNAGRFDFGCYNSDCYPFNEKEHFGVDAWHGCYWYSPIYMPKWPQL